MENPNQPKRLYRSREKMLAGVLAGFAEYINADPTIIRVAYVLLSILSAGFPGLLVYIIFWAITPQKPA
jgi:phage shock protein C